MALIKRKFDVVIVGAGGAGRTQETGADGKQGLEGSDPWRVQR